jgi:hypothetical protein
VYLTLQIVFRGAFDLSLFKFMIIMKETIELTCLMGSHYLLLEGIIIVIVSCVPSLME